VTTPIGVGLTADEQARFERDGFVGPFSYAGEEKMAVVRSSIEREVLEGACPDPRHRFESRHRDHRIVYDVCADDALVGRVASLLGPDVVLWNSVFFCKGPGGRQVPWHQDRDFLFLDPCVNVAAWVAIDPSRAANGCLQVIPGSHTRQVPHVPRAWKHQFIARADPRFVDETRAVDVPLEAGEFILFHKDLLHHSATNLTLQRRLGLVVRYTVPGVRVNDDGLAVGQHVYCVRGEDRIRSNPLAVPPAS
jgi:ectoine hydroxylase-related dioxygenase (phytanoyl-CoA dioxygenase family)